jgi:hypothetical protein
MQLLQSDSPKGRELFGKLAVDLFRKLDVDGRIILQWIFNTV